jgi:RNA polymerase sigma-70 factor, ECF subfamily
MTRINQETGEGATGIVRNCVSGGKLTGSAVGIAHPTVCGSDGAAGTYNEGMADLQVNDETTLVAAAVAGDRGALERLLLAHYDELAQRVAAKLPARLQATQAVEDILQVTFSQAFRDIGRFEPRAEGSFGKWLAKIAENRLVDAIKQHDCEKRGGGMRQVANAGENDSRVLSLWDWLAAEEDSPSSVVARDEALAALQVALASLPADQQEAIRLTHLDCKSVAEVAAAMGKTEGAVRGLVHRGKQQLQAVMGRASRWLRVK